MITYQLITLSTLTIIITITITTIIITKTITTIIITTKQIMEITGRNLHYKREGEGEGFSLRM